jgi:hypothetical protein
VAFDLQEFIALRPFVYHVTDRTNVARLRRLRCIQPAADLLNLAGQKELIRQRRTEAKTIVIDSETVILKDQSPLIFANVVLAPVWSAEDFVEYLNEHVYFWPGSSGGPVESGARLHDRYRVEEPAVVRVRTADLLSANQSQVPLFCPYNSGAPRMQAGRGAPRGPDLFQPATKFQRTPGKVVELVFCCEVHLPPRTELSERPSIWTAL